MIRNICQKEIIVKYASVLIIGLCLIAIQGCSNPKKRSSLNLPENKFESISNPEPTAKTLVTTANILTAQGKFAESEMLLGKAIQIQPEFLPAYNSLAELKMRQGKTDDAVIVLELGLKQQPENSILLNNLGMCRLMQKEYQAALEAFSKAAGMKPGVSRYRANMAVSLGLLGRYDEAKALFEQIITAPNSQHNIDILKEASNNI